MAFNRLTLIKVVELILVIFCCFFHYKSFNTFGSSGEPMYLFLMSGTYMGYLIIMCGLFLGFFVDTAFGRRTDLYFTLLGGVLFLSCGIIAYNEFNDYKIPSDANKYGMWKAYTSLAAGILYFVDALFTFRTE